MAAVEDGEDKLIAVARHIARTIGRTDTMTDDIIQIFSAFDRRFSPEKLATKADAAGRSLRSLDRKLSPFLSFDSPIWSSSGGSEAFLKAIDALIETKRGLDPSIPEHQPLLEHADDLLYGSMLRLEDEFRHLLDQESGEEPSPSDPFSYDSDGDVPDDCDGGIPVAKPVTDYNIVIDCLSWGTVSDLYDIAKRMGAAGYGKACAHAYSVSRLGFLQESLSRLGLHSWTTEEVHRRPWRDLDEEIQRWAHALRVSVRVLFPSERRLCDRVFSDLSPLADLSFAEVCRDPALQLLGFADAVAVASKQPERLFRVVDMYEALRDLIPEIDALFAGERCGFIRSEAGTVCARLGVTVRGILTELENLIRRDPAKDALPGGGVHPIARYVMNYLKAASASWRTLEEIMEEDEEEDHPTATFSSRADLARSSSSLAVQISWIMEILLGNIEAKSKAYRDPALCCVFLMNNSRYVIEKVKGTELGQVLGEDWIRQQMAKVRQWHKSYQRSTWGKVIEVLQIDEGGSSGSGSSSASAAKSLREKFRRFNVYFEEICRTQAGWAVADEQLRAELRISAAGFVLPAYRNFLGRSRPVVEGGKHVEKCVKYSAEDVEARINELFQGGGGGKKL